jgi:hypothetical protein
MTFNKYWLRAKRWLRDNFCSKRNMVMFPFHEGSGNNAINYRGYVNRSHVERECVYDGIVRVMKVAGLSPGWEERGHGFGYDVWLLDMVFDRYHQVKALKGVRRVSNPSERNRKPKSKR